MERVTREGGYEWGRGEGERERGKRREGRVRGKVGFSKKRM